MSAVTANYAGLLFDPYSPLCPHCNESWRVGEYRGETFCENCLTWELRGGIYFATDAWPSKATMVKIGWSSDVYTRLYQLHKKFGTDEDPFLTFPGTREHERELHRWFAPDLVRGREWFRFTPTIRTWADSLPGDTLLHVENLPRPVYA